MLRKLREHTNQEQGGFSLIELLVVILIIGVLAAIALPAFLNQRDKGYDADAKSNARNLVSSIEACYSTTQNYGSCENEATSEIADSGIPMGTADGQAEVVDANTNGNSFEIVGHSRSGNDFTITKTSGGAPVRTCTTGGTGGCPETGATDNW